MAYEPFWAQLVIQTINFEFQNIAVHLRLLCNHLKPLLIICDKKKVLVTRKYDGRTDARS